jgi:predicted dehydrogenase
MHIKPEDRPIGKENFETAIAYGKDSRGGMSRRDFLVGTLAAGAVSGAGLGAMYFGYGKTLEKPVRIGFIGTGDEGSVLIGAHTPSYAQCVAIADIRPYNIHRAFHGDYSSDNAFQARPGLMAKYGWSSEDEARKHVKVYSNYEDLLKAVENKELDIEGVIIALPLHLHAEAAIKAMRAGLHVLTEKLMARTVAQCKEMGRASKETNKLLATGHQRHYSILYDNAIHTIKNGLLGDLHHIRAQWHRWKDTWAPPLPGDKAREKSAIASVKKRLEDFTKAKKPADIEKMRRLLVQTEKQFQEEVDAAGHGYQAKQLAGGYKISPLEELVRWRLWDRTGGGLMAELGSHQLDAAGIFCTAVRNDGEKALPLTVMATGGRHIYKEDRECEDHVYCMYEYPGPKYEEDPNKKIVVTYSSLNGSPFGDYGESVMGTDRTLLLLREQEALIFDNAGPSTKISVGKADTLDTTASGGGAAVGQAAMEAGPISRGYTEEIEHWAWCIRNPAPENQPRCHPKVALADAVIALTTNIAIRNPEHSRIEFKKEWFDINSDETPELMYLKDDRYKVTMDRPEYKPKA